MDDFGVNIFKSSLVFLAGFFILFFVALIAYGITEGEVTIVERIFYFTVGLFGIGVLAVIGCGIFAGVYSVWN